MPQLAEPAGAPVLESERRCGMNGNILMVIIIVTMVFLFLLIVVTPLVSAA